MAQVMNNGRTELVSSVKLSDYTTVYTWDPEELVTDGFFVEVSDNEESVSTNGVVFYEANSDGFAHVYIDDDMSISEVFLIQAALAEIENKFPEVLERAQAALERSREESRSSEDRRGSIPTIKVTVGNNVTRVTIELPVTNSVESAFEKAEVDPGNRMVHLNGVVVPSRDETFDELGIEPGDHCYLLTVIKADNA